MAGDTANCAQIRERMLDAASNSLSGTLRASFDAHLAGCAACTTEFRRVQTLLQAIDHRVSASVAAEPSPRLMANVRREIAAQPGRVRPWWSRSVWLTAAGACAALALLMLTLRFVHKFNSPAQGHVAVSIHSPSPAKSTAHPRLNATIESAAAAQPRKQAGTHVHRLSGSGVHQNFAEPEVIVQPGQMQAVLQLVSAAQKREIDGANLLDSQKTSEPFEIKPLTIAPLKISALKDDSESLTSSSSQDGTQE